MREIKFRAWVKPLGHYWICKEAFSRFMYGFITCESNGGGGDENLRPEDFILEQYTGLKDIYHTDLYEGDIVSHLCKGGMVSNPEIYISKVEWNEVHLCWGLSANPRGPVMLGSSGLIQIGNINENPELLNEGD